MSEVEAAGRFGVAALRLAAAGVHVFPIRRGGKVPAIPSAHPDGDPLRGECRGTCGRQGHGLWDAARDPATVAAWWSVDHLRNVGVATGQSGLFVVDLDGADGIAQWRRLVARHGADETLVASTPSGGLHLLYAARVDRPLGNSASKLAPHIDTRGHGGYIVAAPSTRPDGAYRWAAVPQVDRLPPVPAWIVDALTPRPAPRLPVIWTPGTASKALDGLARTVANAAPKTRNHTLNWAAYRAGEKVAAGLLDRVAVEAALTAAALAAGLDDGETEKTLASGLDKAMGAGR